MWVRTVYEQMLTEMLLEIGCRCRPIPFRIIIKRVPAPEFEATTNTYIHTHVCSRSVVNNYIE